MVREGPAQPRHRRRSRILRKRPEAVKSFSTRPAVEPFSSPVFWVRLSWQ
jgi:hypothetical protein